MTTGERKAKRASAVIPNKAHGSANGTSNHESAHAKREEFHTRYIDIQRVVEADLEFDPDTFCDKVV